MRPIYIPQLLKAPQQTETLELRELLPELPTLTPIQGSLRVRHCESYLEVTVRAEAIITLSCDRCLQQYNHRLVCQTSELIWLQEPEAYPAELEVAPEDLVESLSPDGYFDPQDWLYQQLCLDLPLQKLCDLNCPGIFINPEENRPLPSSQPVDRRWAGLEALLQPSQSPSQT